MWWSGPQLCFGKRHIDDSDANVATFVLHENVTVSERSETRIFVSIPVDGWHWGLITRLHFLFVAVGAPFSPISQRYLYPSVSRSMKLPQSESHWTKHLSTFHDQHGPVVISLQSLEADKHWHSALCGRCESVLVNTTSTDSDWHVGGCCARVFIHCVADRERDTC